MPHTPHTTHHVQHVTVPMCDSRHQVWLAEWTGVAVAVKELLGFSGSPDDSKIWQEMQNEVHMLGTYNHPNIMRWGGWWGPPFLST